VDIPVVFLTAKAQQMELNELKEMGAEGVLTKPFDPMTLPDQIRPFFSS
jgi:CheY-like chemotaxis protein